MPTNFPPECNNELFFNSCQQMLTQDGFAVFNLGKPQRTVADFAIN